MSSDSPYPYSDSSKDDNGFDHLVEATLSFNTSCNVYVPGRYELVAEYPISFYDRHLDPRLVLKHVEIIPSMVQLLSDVCDQELPAFQLVVPPPYYPAYKEVPGSITSSELWSSEDIAKAYQTNLGNFCAPYPSRLYFHPRYDDWLSVFDFTVHQTSKYRESFISEAFISPLAIHTVPHVPNYKPRRYDPIDAAVLPKLREVAAHSPQLAVWDFYPSTISGEKVVKAMQNAQQFLWEVAHTTGIRNPSASSSASSHPADSQNHFLKGLLRKRAITYHRIAQVQIKKSGLNNARAIKKSGANAPSLSSQPSKMVRPYRANPSHFLQHAWARAVANDATFIIFNCGRYERIGVRHRASQTLFLSGLIDTVECRKPAYGKIHVGLHFAVFQDVLSRQQLRPESSKNPNVIGTAKTTPAKRKLDVASSTNPKTSKRAKREKNVKQRHSATKGLADSLHSQAIQSALSNRNLVLISLNYGVHRSSIPSPFIRRGPSCASGFYAKSDSFQKSERRAAYFPHQYVSLNLDAPIDTGATGTAHRASAEITLESGEILKHTLVVKLVFPESETRPAAVIERVRQTEKDRLLHEFSIYRHLASAGVVGGILPVYGLFEDVDSGTLALIMEDGGISLRAREVRETGAATVITVISQAERDMLIRTMKSIHKVGVRHRDIRTENILVNTKDEAFIIDFDRAEFQLFPSGPLDRELMIMQDIVDGLPTPDIYSFLAI